MRLVVALALCSVALAFTRDFAEPHFFDRLRAAYGGAVNSGFGPCPAQPTPLPLYYPLPQSLLDSFTNVDSIFKGTLNETSIPGVAAAIIYNGEIVHTTSLGTANKDMPGVPPTIDTLMRIGSITKSLTALMMYQMEFDGLIESINDPVSQYIDGLEFNNPWPTKGDVTWRNLASQLSGLPRNTPCTGDCNVTMDDMLPIINAMRLQTPPNTIPSYSNMGFALLGRALEQVLGGDYEDYVVDNIFGPLGMNSSGLDITPEVIAQLAPSYLPNGSWAGVAQLGWQIPAGGAFSTVSDLSRYAMELLKAGGDEDGETLPNETLKEWLQVVYLNPDANTAFGAPWEMFRTNNYLVRTKGGNIDAYSALVAVVPELDLAVTAIWNGMLDEFNASVMIFNELVPAFVEMLTPEEPELPIIAPPSTTDFVGSYSAAGIPGAAFNLVAQGPYIFLDMMTFQIPLSYVDTNVFQLWIPSTLQTCIDNEFSAMNGAYVNIDTDYQGQAVSATLPGDFFGITFDRSN